MSLVGLRSWAHPRLRGADVFWGVLFVGPEGSSPLTRGGQLKGVFESLSGGLIPAYAGRTPCYPLPHLRGTAHPRLRGADDAVAPDTAFMVGSSPLTRGGQAVMGRDLHAFRLIPAYAGRTGRARASEHMDGAHPRLRGADFNIGQRSAVAHGSSPLTRGGPCRCRRTACLLGLIPAYAGRTQSATCYRRKTWAHPRLRGADPTR